MARFYDICDIQQREFSHLKPGNCHPKNIANYPHLLSSEKRAYNKLRKIKSFLLIPN